MSVNVASSPDSVKVAELRRRAKGRMFGWVQPSSTALSWSIRNYSLARREEAAILPPIKDLRAINPPIYNQGNLNTCTAQVMAALIDITRVASEMPLASPSRLFIYWFTRAITGQQNVDNGASIKDSISAVLNHGYCFESLWPYVQDNLFLSPSALAQSDSLAHRVNEKIALDGLQQIKQSISNSRPVAFGLRVYSSFFDADENNGVVPIPDPNEPSFGHAGLLVGYDDAQNRLIMRNSWGLQMQDGTPCGDQGYYYLPYDYFSGPFTSDYWTIGNVAG